MTRKPTHPSTAALADQMLAEGNAALDEFLLVLDELIATRGESQGLADLTAWLLAQDSPGSAIAMLLTAMMRLRQATRQR